MFLEMFCFVFNCSVFHLFVFLEYFAWRTLEHGNCPSSSQHSNVFQQCPTSANFFLFCVWFRLNFSFCQFLIFYFLSFHNFLSQKLKKKNFRTLSTKIFEFGGN